MVAQATDVGRYVVPNRHCFKIEYLDAFDFLSEEFQTLYETSNATVFQHPLWLHLMYQNLIPKCGVDPVIITVRDPNNGSLKSVLPLVRSSYVGLSCIEPADLGICDYNAAITVKELGDDLLSDDRLREKIINELRPVHLIFFRKVSKSCEVIEQMLGEGDVGVMESCAHDVDLFAPYEDWKKAIMSSSFRKTLRRNRRKLEEFGEVSYEVLDDPVEIQLAMDLMREQRSARYDDDLFQRDTFFDFYSKVAKEGARIGLAQTSILRAGGDVVAVEFGLIHNHCYHFILGGITEGRYAKLSPGILAMDYVLEFRAEQGDRRADFTIGDEAYKARFGATPTPLKHMAQAESLMGSLALQAYNQGGLIKTIAKKVVNMTSQRFG